MSSTTKKKYVEKEFAEDFSLPTENQTIMKILKPRGNNLHQVITSEGEECLASMPPKFRKHIWVKRGDFVITEPIPEGNKVKSEIVKILTRDHIKYYTQQNIWPKGFTEEESSSAEGEKCVEVAKNTESDDLLFENPNRPQLFYESESSDLSDSDSNS